MSDREYIEKKEKIFNLLMQVDDPLVAKFLDPAAEDLLDEKIEVLTALKEGKQPAEIPNYHKVLAYPEGQWD